MSYRRNEKEEPLKTRRIEESWRAPVESEVPETEIKEPLKKLLNPV